MKTKAKAKTTPKMFNRLARHIAEDEHLNNFKSRRGLGSFSDMDKLYLYDNSPRADGKHFRDEQLAAFRQRLQAEGITEVGFGVYPETGEDAGYTVAMILDCGEDRYGWVREAYLEYVRDTVRKMDEQRETVAG
jgi:hypothetical protein